MSTVIASTPHTPPHAELDHLAVLAAEVIARCKAAGADEVEVRLSVAEGLTVNVRRGEVETLEHTRDRGLALTVYQGGRKGSAQTADLAEASIDITVRQAIAIARHTECDPAAGLPDPARLATRFPDLDLWHPAAPDAAGAIEIARQCEAAAFAADSRIRNSEGASLNWSRGWGVLANSLGFVGREYGTHASLACSVIAGEGEGMQRDDYYDSARGFAFLADPASIGAEAARRAVMRLGARPVPTCQVPIVFSAELARGFFGHLVSAASGGPQYRRASFLLDMQGQKVLPDWLDLVEEPHLPRGPGSAAFDDEGVATVESALVERGVLARYVLGSYAARKLGLSSTGNAGGVRNLRVTTNAGGLDELLQEMGTGIYVTELLGQGVNIVTGDYSRGAAGFWVENGRIVHPVEEITIAGNLRAMYAGIRAVGTPVDTRGNVRSGPVLLSPVTVAGGIRDHDPGED